MKFLLILAFHIILYSCYAQQYEVLDARKVITSEGKKIRKGSLLLAEDSISISAKGYLTLDVESAMHLKLGAGNYKVGKEAKRLNQWYNTHLELTTLLKRENLISCKFRYKTLAVPGSNRHYEVDRIEVDQKPLVNIRSDTTQLTIEWVNPDHRFEGKYYVIVRDFYNHGFIDVLETKDNTITFYPGRYGHKYMYYSILASNCRASLRHKIQVLHPDAHIYDRTSFINEDN